MFNLIGVGPLSKVSYTNNSYIFFSINYYKWNSIAKLKIKFKITVSFDIELDHFQQNFSSNFGKFPKIWIITRWTRFDFIRHKLCFKIKTNLYRNDFKVNGWQKEETIGPTYLLYIDKIPTEFLFTDISKQLNPIALFLHESF